MKNNKDYKELLRFLNQEKVEYLIVGAYAVIFYTEPRYTKDIDVWIKPDPKNAHKTYCALKKFGAPVSGLTEKDLTDPELVYQIGIEPNRVDILMDVDGVSFDQAWKNRRTIHFEDEKVYVLALDDLIKSKKKTNRMQDKLDLEKLLLLSSKKNQKS